MPVSLVFGCFDFAHGLLLLRKLVAKTGCVICAKAILFCIARGPWQADRKLLCWGRELKVKEQEEKSWGRLRHGGGHDVLKTRGENFLSVEMSVLLSGSVAK